MADSSLETVTVIGRRFALADFFRRLVKEKPLGLAGGIITLLLLLTGIFADVIAPYGMNETNMDHYLAAPSSEHLLGADNLGRDILSRVIYGARISVIVGLAASVLATVVSLIIGSLTAYLGGKLDLIVQRIVDAWMCIPMLLFCLAVMSAVGAGMVSLIVVVGLMWGVVGSRIIRAAVIGVRENMYVEATKAIGCTTARIIIRHILPNIMAPAIILFSTRVPNVILIESSLSFLGFGIPPPDPSWGGMISGTGRAYMYEAPWIAIYPGLALAIVVYGINMFGDAVRDLLDPRLRGGVGRFDVRVKKKP
jgi:peptide/nickel transport system permease protein